MLSRKQNYWFTWGSNPRTTTITGQSKPLGHPDTVVTLADNLWECLYHNVSQLMGLRYSPVLNESSFKLQVQSNLIIRHIKPLTHEALDVVRIHQLLSTCISWWIRFLHSSTNTHRKAKQEFRP